MKRKQKTKTKKCISISEEYFQELLNFLQKSYKNLLEYAFYKEAEIFLGAIKAMKKGCFGKAKKLFQRLTADVQRTLSEGYQEDDYMRSVRNLKPAIDEL